MNKIGTIVEHNGERFFLPTRADIEALQVGDLAPSSMSTDDPDGFEIVTEITHKGVDIHGKAFACYYTRFGEGATISTSMKEDELYRTLRYCIKRKSYELDQIEKALLAKRA